MSVWVNKKIEKLLRVWCCEVITFLRTEIKTELRCNMYNDVIAEEKCNIWCRAERCSLITVLSLIFFWIMSFWQINYTVKMMFCDVNDAVTVIK